MNRVSLRSCVTPGAFARRAIFRLARAFPGEGNYDTGFIGSHIEQLAEKYDDRKPDLADLCLVRMSELYPLHPILTVDADFSVYRRNKRESIPLLSPPGRS